MLASIKEILSNIGNFFSTVIDYVVGFIEDLVYFMGKLASSVTDALALLDDIFPVEIITIFGSLIAVVVILRILGRD